MIDDYSREQIDPEPWPEACPCADGTWQRVWDITFLRPPSVSLCEIRLASAEGEKFIAYLSAGESDRHVRLTIAMTADPLDERVYMAHVPILVELEQAIGRVESIQGRERARWIAFNANSSPDRGQGVHRTTDYGNSMVEGRFRRTHGGITSFASVSVALADEKGASGAIPIESQFENTPGLSSQHAHADWWQAAVQAIGKLLNGAGRTETVLVCRVRGTSVDTTPDAVACAAAFAVCELLGMNRPDVSSEPPWRILTTPPTEGKV